MQLVSSYKVSLTSYEFSNRVLLVAESNVILMSMRCLKKNKNSSDTSFMGFNTKFLGFSICYQKVISFIFKNHKTFWKAKSTIIMTSLSIEVFASPAGARESWYHTSARHCSLHSGYCLTFVPFCDTSNVLPTWKPYYWLKLTVDLDFYIYLL